MLKQLGPKKEIQSQRLTDLTPEERRQAVEGTSQREFFRRLRTIPEWRKNRLADFGPNSR